MMGSPAKRYLERMQAQAAFAAEGEAYSDTYKLLLADLKKDKQILKAIESIQDKQLAKKEMLPRYQAWVDGVLKNPQPLAHDEVFSTVLLWRIDAGLLDEAVPLAVFAIEHQMANSDEFKRSLVCIIFEQIAARLREGIGILAENLNKLVEMAKCKAAEGFHKINIPDQVRAKFFKAAGRFYLEKLDDKASAKALFELALVYDTNCGVKKKIEELAEFLQASPL